MRWLLPLLAFMLLMPIKAEAMVGKCGSRSEIVQVLKVEREQTREATGLIGEDGEIGGAELFVSREGTWTMIVTLVEKRKTCIIAAGDEWAYAPDTLRLGEGT